MSDELNKMDQEREAAAAKALDAKDKAIDALKEKINGKLDNLRKEGL